MENRIKARGRIVYDPKRENFNKTHKMRTMIIDLPKDDLDRLYMWFVARHVKSYANLPHTTDTVAREKDENETWMRPYHRPGASFELLRPMYGKHITIVGGNEHVKNMHLWKKHEGEIVEFEYAPVPRQHWQFWSLPVYGDHLQEFRRELGLKDEKDFHITIGRLHDWQPVPRAARRKAWEARKQLEEEGVL